MSSLSIRGIDDELSERLKQLAIEEQKSVNSVVLNVLKQHLGIIKGKKFTQSFHDLDQLFGSWDSTQFNTIQGTVDSERHIDPEIWKWIKY